MLIFRAIASSVLAHVQAIKANFLANRSLPALSSFELVINLLLYRKKIMQTMVMFPCKFSGMC
jgi:hypothetical protein